jgi:hypothetical protein
VTNILNVRFKQEKTDSKITNYHKSWEFLIILRNVIYLKNSTTPTYKILTHLLLLYDSQIWILRRCDKSWSCTVEFLMIDEFKVLKTQTWFLEKLSVYIEVTDFNICNETKTNSEVTINKKTTTWTITLKYYRKKWKVKSGNRPPLNDLLS